MVIPKPCCSCRVCTEARKKGIPYRRTGPSAFIHDENLLIDTPAEIALQLNRCDIKQVKNIMFTHTDPDHIEGFRVVEQITLDFRNWKAYPEKQIQLILPEYLYKRLKKVCSAYGPLIDFYESQGFVSSKTFTDHTVLNGMKISAIGVDRGSQIVFVYVFEKQGRRIVYAPCDIKPFPESRSEIQNPDLLVIQPGIFETGLKHDFFYPPAHISRKTLYTFEQTLALSRRINARRVLFVHLEEYWNRSHDDYLAIAEKHENIIFAYDGFHISV